MQRETQIVSKDAGIPGVVHRLTQSRDRNRKTKKVHNAVRLIKNITLESKLNITQAIALGI